VPFSIRADFSETLASLGTPAAIPAERGERFLFLPYVRLLAKPGLSPAPEGDEMRRGTRAKLICLQMVRAWPL